ncbi:MAG: ATP-binding protein, partial [Gemmatimonadales bacterium]
VWAEGRRVGGILVTVQETTRRVLAERRTRVLRDLAARSPDRPTEAEVLKAALAILGQVPRDLPFAALYLRDGTSGKLSLAGQVQADEADTAWPASDPRLVSALDATDPVRVERHAGAPGGALLVPVPRGESAVGTAGVLVAGLSDRLPLDREYRDFLRAAAGQIGLNLAAVRADEMARHRAEALSAEVTRLADLLEQAPGLLAVVRGPEHVFEVVNPGFREFVGRRDVIGRPMREAFPEIEGQGYFQLLDRVLATGEPYRATGSPLKLRLTPDGPLVQRYIDFVYQRIAAAPGASAGVFIYGFDVTELHEASRALAVSERRSRLLVESIPQIVWIADALGRLEYVSTDDPWPQVAGVPLTIEARLLARARPEEAERAIATWRSAVEREARFETELRLRLPTGSERWLLVRAVPFRDEETGALRWFGTSTDIDDLKRAEEQLRDAQRMQSVAMLAGGVAHEINNQMTSVLGFGQFVLKALGPDHAQATDMRLVLQSAERAARVSQQLLAFSRQQVTERRNLAPGMLVRELEPVLAQLLGADKHLAIDGAAGDGGGMPSISADPDQVQQVLINLVANARDATDTGGRVGIALEDVSLAEPVPAPLGETIPPGRYVLLSVSDTGRGMTPEILARIFDPFFTTKEVGAGTGLGLSMVHGTLRRHGGYVRAVSTPGAGSTFELYWPVAADGASEVAGDATERKLASGSARGPASVLVIEDEPNVRALAVRALAEAGFEVAEAADGAAALAALEGDGGPPDVLVTDVIMPHLNGRQLYDAVRARWPDLPVLFMSGHAGESDVHRRMVPRGAPFLQKPFTPDGLVGAVARLVRG